MKISKNNSGLWVDAGRVFPQYCPVQNGPASEQMHEPVETSKWQQLASMHGKAVSYGYHQAFGYGDVHLYDNGQLWIQNGEIVQIPVNTVHDVYFDEHAGVWQVFIS